MISRKQSVEFNKLTNEANKKENTETTKRLHVVSNTHWDREHRHGFQETQYMLVEAIDKLIKIMENDENFTHFVLDGQSVIIEDYLNIKPEMKDRLLSLIKTGRILIGPWYTLPDMQTVAPESLVRNLLIGDRLSKKYGRKMNFGYSIFSFGQIAQLPQIYNGFGIEDLIVYKGYCKELFSKSEFIWEAPDGSKTLASRLGELFRINFLFCFTIPVILGGDARKPGWSVGFCDGKRLTHLIDKNYFMHHATELEQDIRIRPDKIPQAINDVIESVKDSVTDKTLLAFDGVDFSSPLKEIPKALKMANNLAPNGLEIIQSTPEKYFEELRSKINLNLLMNFTGEMRFGPLNKVHCECLSANMDLKLLNHKAETTLIKYSEPFSAFAMTLNKEYPKELLDRAWSYLLKSHAHDSIHGIGVPKIKRNTIYRLEQTQEIAECAARKSFENIISKINVDKHSCDSIFITVFNPTNSYRSEVINLKLELPGNEIIEDYWVETVDGEKLDIYEYDREQIKIASINAENRPKSIACLRINSDVFVPLIPPCGYKTFKILRKTSLENPVECFPAPELPSNPIAIMPNILDNDLLKVTVNPNGTINVLDQKNNIEQKNLNLFIDSGCSGDMWIHREPCENKIMSNFSSTANISIIKNSYLTGTIRIELYLDIPASLSENKKARSDAKITSVIITDITLQKGSKRIDFKTNFRNDCRDHKLSVKFPTSIKNDFIYSGNAFEIRKRHLKQISSKSGKIEKDILTKPMNNFVTISDEVNGVALYTKGIKEFQVNKLKNKDIEVELTLLRAVTQKFPIHTEVFVDSEDQQSQCLKNFIFEYALYFYQGDFTKGNVIAESEKYQQDLVAGQFGKGSGGTLPMELSFIKTENQNTLISCIKKAEDCGDIVVRLYNPTDKIINDKIITNISITKAFEVNMNESVINEMDISNKELNINIPPYKIITLLLKR